MRQRPDARGYVELVGPTWWLKRWALEPDPDTGELVRHRRRVRLGPRTELRTRAAARAAADAWLARIAPHELVPGPRVLAVQYLEQFLAVHVPLMRPTSQLKYRTVIRVYLEPALAGLQLAEVDTAALRGLVAAQAGLRARSTVASIRGIALQVLRQAVRDGFGACRIDPRDVRLPAAGVERTRRYFRPDELERILAAAAMPWRALWGVMGYAGLRVGEALGLTWSHVNFEQHILLVRQAAIAGELAALKTRTSRGDVPILPELEQLLREHREQWQPNDAGLLFATRRGTPLAADYVRRVKLQPLLNALCLPPAGCHAFRHGLPARLAAAGVSSNVIQQIMRHATLTMTESYLHTRAADTWRSLTHAGFQHAPPPAAATPPEG